MSQKIEKFIGRYVAAHMEGNPQLRLDPFIEKTEEHTCFLCEGHFPLLYRVKFISGLVANVCEGCLEEYKQRSTVKKILGKVS